jgi:ABC-2 type transport system permease protein
VQNSAAAIAAYFVLNPAVALLGTVSALVADWIDTATTWNWVRDNDWAGHEPQILFSIVLWVAVPLTAGVIRTIRSDIG